MTGNQLSAGRILGTINLSKQKGLMLGLNLAALLLLVPIGWVVVSIGVWLRPEAAPWLILTEVGWVNRPDGGFSFSMPAGYLVGTIIGTPLVIVFHEAMHGLFFWLFTQRRPRFGFKFLYAYAALPPDVYLTRNPYLVVGLAPLIGLTCLGFLLILMMPLVLLPTLVCMLTINAVGSVGDIAVTAWLLRYPTTTLVSDYGDEMIVYNGQD